MGEKKVTFADIAKRTHFSKTTISRYFNRRDTLTPENQAIIAKALDDLNYHENKIAQVLAKGRTEIVGIIIPTMFYHYYAELLTQVLRSYEQYGYKFLVFVGGSDPDEERKYVRELLAYKIEGLIVVSHTISSRELASYEVPVVGIEREDRHIASVSTDNYMGGMQATSVLAKNHCDVLIHVNTFVSRSVPSYGRIQGFLDICSEYNLRHELVQRKFRDSYVETNQTMREVLGHIESTYPGMRKGLFFGNDTYANVALNNLVREHGGLTDEYRIVGFDDSPIAEQAVVPITTIGQQIELLAHAAMELLVDQIEERKKSGKIAAHNPVHRKIPPVLIHRDTTD